MARSKKSTSNEAEILLGSLLHKLRLAKGMTRMQVAKMVNKKEQQIAKYESGDFIPLPMLEGIAEALGEPIQKKWIRKISFLRKLENEDGIEQPELIEIYQDILENTYADNP